MVDPLAVEPTEHIVVLLIDGLGYRALRSHAAEAQPQLIYAYLGDLDLIGHKYGPDSDAWTLQLAVIDRAVELLVASLRQGVSLLVTADHGMAEVPAGSRIDYDTSPALQQGVAHLVGESRARFVHVEEGQLAAVRQRWQEFLGERVDVRSAEEVIVGGWLGPEVTPRVRARIGELVAVSRNDAAIVRSHAERPAARMPGNHGALSDAEALVPLLEHRS